MKKKEIVPIFFATDDNYAPFLAVSVKSLLATASKEYFYKIHVLSAEISEENKNKLLKMKTKNSSIEFCDLSRRIDELGAKLHLRDYYTRATYYRFFIANLFTQYDKALYLDCDIALVGDISILYKTELGTNLLCAAPEEVMREVEVFGNYVEKFLGIACQNYFSAGVLLMNLKLFREEKIEEQFIELLSRYKFAVTQDQDYLNVLCKDRVVICGEEWNKSPFGEEMSEAKLMLVHYKLNWKPWHYDNIMYEKYFWHYAKKTSYYTQILKIKANYTEEFRIRDQKAYENLVQLALFEQNNEKGYCRYSVSEG